MSAGVWSAAIWKRISSSLLVSRSMPNPLKFDANHARALMEVNCLAPPSHILLAAKLPVSEKAWLG